MSEPQRSTMISATDIAGMTATIFFVGAGSLFVVLTSFLLIALLTFLP